MKKNRRTNIEIVANEYNMPDVQLTPRHRSHKNDEAIARVYNDGL